MTSRTLRISLGNKVIGIMSYAAIILLALSFTLLSFRWETLLVTSLLICIYSFQASKISYITLNQGKFFVENIFSSVVKKDVSLFDEVNEIVPFTHLMRIKFKDGSRYFFWGKSDMELNRFIRETIGRDV